MSHAREPGRFWASIDAADAFFMKTGPVHETLRKLVAALDELAIPYAIVGGMALNAYGHERVTVDVDVLMTRESLERFKAHWLGRGYVERFPGSRGLRDTEHDVPIDVLIVGDFPGDGKPKAVHFPDPASIVERREIPVLPIAKFVELKLASGMSTIHRAKDLGDVVELVKTAALPRELADSIDASVRDKYLEIWDALQTPDPFAE